MKSKSMPEDAKWSMRGAKNVLLNVNNFTLPEDLVPKNGALFSIVYKLELPSDIKVRLTFHVSSLKSFEVDTL